MSTRLPGTLTNLLDNGGLPWYVTRGSKHLKIFVAGRLAAIFPRGSPRNVGKGTKNLQAQLRRKIRELQ